MSTLYLIRHGQASFGQADYDRLSGLGEQQMRRLGEYWLQWGVKIDAVYSGSLLRQTASARCVNEIYAQAGKPLPQPVILQEFNEYETRHLLTGSLSSILAQNPEISELVKEISKAPPGISGLARATMALTVIMVLGVATIHILVERCETGDSQIVNNVLSMLSGLLAAITGFYFGGRSAEKATEESRKVPPDAQPNKTKQVNTSQVPNG